MKKVPHNRAAFNFNHPAKAFPSTKVLPVLASAATEVGYPMYGRLPLAADYHIQPEIDK
jgi:hypothetical protein